MADILSFQPRVRGEPAPMTPKQTRHMIEAAAQSALDTAERLIAVLDEMDGEADREDGGDDEPSLGAPEGQDCAVVWMRGGDRDLEMK